MIDDNDAATAIQINQLTYAYIPDFQKEPYGTVEDQSFFDMVRNLHNVPVPNDDHTGYNSRAVTLDEKLEMLASRFAARNGRYPTETELADMRDKLTRGQ